MRKEPDMTLFAGTVILLQRSFPSGSFDGSTENYYGNVVGWQPQLNG